MDYRSPIRLAEMLTKGNEALSAGSWICTPDWIADVWELIVLKLGANYW